LQLDVEIRNGKVDIHATGYVGQSLCWCSFVDTYWVVLCWPLLLNFKALQSLGFFPH